MTLLISNRLDEILEPSQETVGLPQSGDRLHTKSAIIRQGGQYFAQRLLPQIFATATTNKLQRLHNEFYLPDAAGAELDVVCELTTLDLRSDQRVHLAQGFEDPIVEITSVHER